MRFYRIRLRTAEERSFRSVKIEGASGHEAMMKAAQEHGAVEAYNEGVHEDHSLDDDNEDLEGE